MSPVGLPALSFCPLQSMSRRHRRGRVVEGAPCSFTQCRKSTRLLDNIQEEWMQIKQQHMYKSPSLTTRLDICTCQSFTLGWKNGHSMFLQSGKKRHVLLAWTGCTAVDTTVLETNRDRWSDFWSAQSQPWWLITWPGWGGTCVSAADVSEGTVWFGAAGIVFTIWMDEKAFIPKLTAWKCSLKKKKNIKKWLSDCRMGPLLLLRTTNTHLHCVVGWWYKHSSPLLHTGQNLHLSITFCFFNGMASSSAISMSITSSARGGGITKQDREPQLERCQLFLSHLARTVRKQQTFWCCDPSLQSVKDADFGLPVEVHWTVCDLWGGSYIIQLHFTVCKIPQWTRHAVQRHDELGAGRISPLLTNARKHTQSRKKLNNLWSNTSGLWFGRSKAGFTLQVLFSNSDFVAYIQFFNCLLTSTF